MAAISVALVGLVSGTLLLVFPIGQSSFARGLQVLGGLMAFVVAIVWSLTAVAKLWRESAPALPDCSDSAANPERLSGGPIPEHTPQSADPPTVTDGVLVPHGPPSPTDL
jgi:hypothetical protein